MTDNSNHTFPKNQLTEETTNSVYEHPEEENSSTTTSNNFWDQISCDENALFNESVTNENISVN